MLRSIRAGSPLQEKGIDFAFFETSSVCYNSEWAWDHTGLCSLHAGLEAPVLIRRMPLMRRGLQLSKCCRVSSLTSAVP